jgi:arylsulfatase A-like enzyme
MFSLQGCSQSRQPGFARIICSSLAWGALFLISGALFTGCGDKEKSGPEKMRLKGSLTGRNVVLIVPDSLNADHLSCYGYFRPTSPNMDRLARAGVRFTHAFSQTSWTLSSVASLFTSLEQERHGVLRMDEALGRLPTTLAELFQDAGYHTVAIMQNELIRKETGLDRGFDLYKFYPYDEGGTERCLAFTEELLSSDLKKPFFAYLHFMPPHAPYTPPEDFQNRFDPDYEGPVEGSIDDCVFVQKNKKRADDPDVLHLVALYDEYIQYIDSEIGKLVAAVEEAGRAEKFLFLITSDHGEAFMQHGKQGHNAHVFDEMIRVPLILHAPDGPLPSGVVIDSVASLLDILPTLIELCGLSSPEQAMDGRSLAPLLEEPGRRLDRSLYFTSRYKKEGTMDTLQIAVREGSMKLVLTGKTGEIDLYDLVRDPGETRDLLGERPQMGRELERKLRNWFSEASADRKLWEGKQTVPLTDDQKQQLEALGYTGD